MQQAPRGPGRVQQPHRRLGWGAAGSLDVGAPPSHRHTSGYSVGSPSVPSVKAPCPSPQHSEPTGAPEETGLQALQMVPGERVPGAAVSPGLGAAHVPQAGSGVPSPNAAENAPAPPLSRPVLPRPGHSPEVPPVQPAPTGQMAGPRDPGDCCPASSARGRSARSQPRVPRPWRPSPASSPRTLLVPSPPGPHRPVTVTRLCVPRKR